MGWENSGFPETFCQLFRELFFLPFRYFVAADDLSYRSVGSIDQADLEMPDAFEFTALGSGSDTGSFSFGSRSLAGIGTTTELGCVNSIGKDLMANGRFNIGKEVRWTSFAKTFDVVG